MVAVHCTLFYQDKYFSILMKTNVGFNSVDFMTLPKIKEDWFQIKTNQ